MPSQSPRLSRAQKKTLLEYMLANSNFGKTPDFNLNHISLTSQQWQALSDELNSMDGSKKSVNQWKTCWIDMKFATKRDKSLKSYTSKEEFVAAVLNSQARSQVWTKEYTSLLIKELKNFPILYNQFDPRRKSMPKRSLAFRKLAARLRPTIPFANEDTVSKKVKSIKYTFFKEREAALKTGQDTPLWFYNKLKYILNTPSNRASETKDTTDRSDDEDMDESPSFNNITLNEDHSYESPTKHETTNDDPDYESNSESHEEANSNYEEYDPFEEVKIEPVELDNHYPPTQAKAPNKYKKMLHRKCMQLLKIISHEIKKNRQTTHMKSQSMQHAPQTLLGMLVESELKSVSQNIFHETKWKIIRVLEEASTLERRLKASAVPSSSNV